MQSANTSGNMPFKYYAFISYKRMDSKWASWLYRKLQNYRLPSKLSRQYRELPKRLCPVFLDKEDLVPGNLSESLRQHIALSKYFIAICSKNSRINPQYIDMELQYFLETHNYDYTKVIPFIVDDSPRPENECFSPLMQILCVQYQLIGVNITERGAHRAFLKVVASMHGLRVAEIESADDIRKRKRAAWISLAAAACLCLCLLGLQYWWQHYAVHVQYYEDHIWVNNCVQGLGPISKNELEDHSRYYRIESIDGYVQSIAYMNYAGTVVPLDTDATVLDQSASRIEFTYTGEKENKHLYMAKFYDYNGLPIVCYQYSADGTHVTLLQDETSGISGYASQGIGTTDMFADKINVSRYVQVFDEKGYLVKRSYACGDDYTLMSDGEGIFGYDLTYDSHGNLESVTYFANRDGSRVGTSGGIATTTYTYDADGVKLATVSYLDEDGAPVVLGEGWTTKAYTWSSTNGLLTISYQDAEGQPALCQDGYATTEKLYIGARSIGQKFLGPEGEPIAMADGYAFIYYRADDRGMTVYARYYDAQNNPTANISDGVYGYEIETESDTKYCKKYVDADGNPMATTEGYAYIYVTTDAYNYPLKQELKDASGNHLEDYYAWRTYAYDEIYHNMTEYATYDSQGNLITDPQMGSAAIRWEYDNRGRRTSLQFIGEDGELVNGPFGYAKIDSYYEMDGGSSTEIHMFFDEKDAPYLHSSTGSYGYECAHNEYGKLIGMYYLDENQLPYYNEKNRFAGVLYLYDEYGYIRYVSYYKSASQQIMVDGYASVYYNHDAQGNLLYCSYYDELGDPVVNLNEGYAAIEYIYDDNNNLTAFFYYDEAGNYMNHLYDGYAGLEGIFDENGELTDSIFWVVEDGELVPLY